MPELPEVETIRRELNQKIKGKTIKDIEVKVPKMVNLPVAEFTSQVKGTRVKQVLRRAKLIILDLYGKYFLLIHLKMTGQLVFVPKSGKTVSGGHPIKNLGALPNKFSHIIFTFADGSKLFFNDIRKFGWIKLVEDSIYLSVRNEFGIEPLALEFTWKNSKPPCIISPKEK